MNFRIDSSLSEKNDIGILMGIELKLLIAFNSIVIFTVLVLLIHEHGLNTTIRWCLQFLSSKYYNFNCRALLPYQSGLYVVI
jgi:hypothetical protein